MNPIALAIHGGCGVMDAAGLPEAEWAEARSAARQWAETAFK